MSGFDWEEMLGVDGDDISDAYDANVADSQCDESKGRALYAPASKRLRTIPW
ncbi:Uncharacterised protein [Mycobacteroides abscessus subsp. bolletii]|nr:Uncharacterised protein [Mycobacteroides abscessus subsp. bolletii]